MLEVQDGELNRPVPICYFGEPPKASSKRFIQMSKALLDEQQILLDVHGQISPRPRVHYLNYSFHVPPNASKVGLILKFHKERLAQIFVSLFSPEGFRGNRMNPGAKGDIELNLWVSTNSASNGGVPGPLITGEWSALIDVERLAEDISYSLIAYAEFGPVPEAKKYKFPSMHVVKKEGGWYKGELHCHSLESDGKYPVAEVVQAAKDIGLDFLSMTDHFTHSQWWKLSELANDSTALIRSLEVTSHQGHANLQGIHKWIDVYVDKQDWSMNQVADEVHEQGGLFCINHPFSGDLAWRAFDFDWSKADLLEIYHNLEGANNHFQPIFWDSLLMKGCRIIGVGGTDSHDPFRGTDQLGQVVTWIYADELSETGILEGLKRGRVYVSRGPELRFTAESSSGQLVEMMETLQYDGQPIRLSLRVKSAEDLRLFIIKNGLLLETSVIPVADEEWAEISFLDDAPQETSFYRIELHKIVKNSDHPGIFWRDYQTTMVLSNPIWVE